MQLATAQALRRHGFQFPEHDPQHYYIQQSWETDVLDGGFAHKYIAVFDVDEFINARGYSPNTSKPALRPTSRARRQASARKCERLDSLAASNQAIPLSEWNRRRILTAAEYLADIEAITPTALELAELAELGELTELLTSETLDNQGRPLFALSPAKFAELASSELLERKAQREFYRQSAPETADDDGMSYHEWLESLPF
jgi:hypothetical protein